MSFYWSYTSVPEFANVPKADRKRIWKEAYRRSCWEPRSWGGIALFIITYTFASDPIKAVARQYLGRPWDFVAGAVYMFFAITFANQLVIRAALPHIRRLIGGLCVHCGYDLRSTPERCPECGRETGMSAPTGQTLD